MNEAGPLTISDLAGRTGLRPDTVRYYERVGLMPRPARTSGDHRRYDALAVDRVRFIRGAQRLGLRLADIKDLLAVRDTGECRLARLRAGLIAMADQLPSATCPDPAPGTWCPPDHRVTDGRCDACSI